MVLEDLILEIILLISFCLYFFLKSCFILFWNLVFLMVYKIGSVIFFCSKLLLIGFLSCFFDEIKFKMLLVIWNDIFM